MSLSVCCCTRWRPTRRSVSSSRPTRRPRSAGQSFRGSAGLMGQHAVEALAEDLTWAIWHIAEPRSAMDTQTHSVAAPGRVERPTDVAAMLTPAPLAAVWARNRFACSLGDEHQAPIVLGQRPGRCTSARFRHPAGPSALTSTPTLGRLAAGARQRRCGSAVVGSTSSGQNSAVITARCERM